MRCTIRVAMHEMLLLRIILTFCSSLLKFMEKVRWRAKCKLSIVVVYFKNFSQCLLSASIIRCTSSTGEVEEHARSSTITGNTPAIVGIHLSPTFQFILSVAKWSVTISHEIRVDIRATNAVKMRRVLEFTALVRVFRRCYLRALYL